MAEPRQIGGPSPIAVEIVTTGEIAWKGEADEVQAPGFLGEFGALPGHAQLLTFTGFGPLTVHRRGEKARFLVGPGVAEVGPGRVTLLVDLCVPAEQVDKDEARRALGEAEKAMLDADPLGEAYAVAKRRADRARAALAI